MEQQVHPRRDHDAGKVVAGEHGGTLDRPGREDHVSARGSDRGRVGPAAATNPPPNTPNAAVSGRNRTFPDPSASRDEAGTERAARLPQQVAAGLAALFEEHDRCARLPRGRRRGEAGGPGSDHEDVGVEVDPAPPPVIRLVRAPSPSPAFDRMNGSTSGHAQRGCWKIL